MNTDCIECWRGQFDNLATSNHWQCLNAAEQVYAETFKNPLLRNRYVIVRSYVRQILAQKLAMSPETIQISKTEYGKPFLADSPELVFNLAHSADTWIVVVGWCCRLGVDIEHAKSRPNFAALVEKCFAESEATYWHSLPKAEQAAEFYRFWTRKEAFVKATGRGIALGLKRCELNPYAPTTFLSVPEEFSPASAWRVMDLEVGQGLFGALAVDREISTIKRMEISQTPRPMSK